MTCPSCGSVETRPSRTAAWADVFQRLRGREPLRCRKCRARFFVKETGTKTQGSAAPLHRRKEPVRRSVMAKRDNLIRKTAMIAVFVVAFAVFLLVLYLIVTRRPEQAPDSSAAILTCVRIP